MLWVRIPPESPGKTAASSHPFHTGIPDDFEKPSRSYNTTQFHKIAGYTSTTSGTLSCRKHIIKHCFTEVHNQLNINSLHSRLQPTHKSSTLQSSSHSPEDGQHRLTEISRHLLNLNSYFQNYMYNMVLPQASPHHLKTPQKATEIISNIRGFLIYTMINFFYTQSTHMSHSLVLNGIPIQSVNCSHLWLHQHVHVRSLELTDLHVHCWCSSTQR